MNKQAPELSPEARRLINEARGADDPTADDHARVKARWLASVAAIAGVSSLTEAARAAGTLTWGFKAAGVALVIAAGAVGLNFALDADDPGKPVAPLPGSSMSSSGSSHERFQKTPPARSDSEKRASGPEPGLVSGAAPAAEAPEAAPTPAIQAMPAPAAPADLAQPQVTRVELPSPATGALEVSSAAASEAAASGVAAPSPPAPAAGATPPSPSVAPPAASRAKPVARAARTNAPKATDKQASAAPPVEAAQPPEAGEASGQLSEELALLADVRSSIQGGASARALDLLNRYETRFGQPILGMEADALRVDALCRAGQREAAREAARVFQNEWPGSPLERRVSAACP